MSFNEIDWSIEKTKLLFREGIRRSEIRRRWPARESLTSMTYNGAILASSYAKPSADGFDLDIEFFDGADEVRFLRKSIIRVSLLKLEQNISAANFKVRVGETTALNSDDLRLFGFRKNQNSLVLDIEPDRAALRISLKNQLKSYIKAAPKVGRGYVLDAEKLNAEAVDELNCEYGEVAWGITNWARHSSLSSDENDMIAQLPLGSHALEVGAGSGRVTEAMLSKFDKITATDIVEETLSHLSRLGAKVNPVLDNIVTSTLPSDAYEVVTFWENGLGGICSSTDRRKAVDQMARVCKPGGLIVIAIRQLLPISVDHLMVAAQTDEVMGIYHTFSDEEMRSYESDNVRLENVVIGGERPAGGIQKFFVYRKI